MMREEPNKESDYEKIEQEETLLPHEESRFVEIRTS
jgi:hypothetical protein